MRTIILMVLLAGCADVSNTPLDASYAEEHECRRTSPHWWKCERPTPEIWVEKE